MQKNKTKAFTLAEVLVTLGIIGVVAALTMPALNQAASKAKIGPELSTAINTLANATEQFMADNNANYLSVAMSKSGCTNNMQAYLQYLVTNNYVKGRYDNSLPSSSYKYSGAKGGLTTSSIGLRLPNGTAIAAADADASSALSGVDGNLELIVITSGYEKRSSELVTGKDMFKIYIYNNGTVMPTTKTQACGAGTDGTDCSGLIAQSGWKVTY